MNFVNPIQENTPTNWTEGPSEKLDIKDSRPNIILILADDMGYNESLCIMAVLQRGRFKHPYRFFSN
ncbi:MAG: hypothetical protein Ct9H90mP4_01610 [Gammaproteobacteria bacterium]|nr:MAG: hypothetical protein Ct9H90mP4_01610 [Gammaproteobacteria bacterium]